MKDIDKPTPFGRLLSAHRARAGFSQLTLSMEAGVSARHLSFLEVGRSRPSVDMVRRLAGSLGLPRQERNALLLAAGYAPEAAQAPSSPGMPHSGQHYFDIAVALASAPTAEAAVELASQALASQGIHHFITGTIRRAPGRLRVERDPQGRPAVAWLRHMELHDYHERDYLLAATAARSRAFSWSEVRGESMRAEQRRILDEAGDYRITNGFVLPIHRPDGSVRALSGWAERLSDDPASRVATTLVATSLLDALDRLAPQRARPDGLVRLLPQHRDTLLRIAHGRPTGAPDLVEQATAVMGAYCPTTAATRALALGLLD